MKTTDQIYHCQMPGQLFGAWQLQCHLRIFLSHDEVQMVTVTNTSLETDMNCDMNWLVPFLVDKLINDVVCKFHLDPAKLVWIEHYTSSFRKSACADFSQVTFEWHNGQATNPQWTAIAPETVNALISEELVFV